MPDESQIEAQTQPAADLADVSPKATPTKHFREQTPRMDLLIFAL
jgi:hypothetical protein